MSKNKENINKDNNLIKHKNLDKVVVVVASANKIKEDKSNTNIINNDLKLTNKTRNINNNTTSSNHLLETISINNKSKDLEIAELNKKLLKVKKEKSLAKLNYNIKNNKLNLLKKEEERTYIKVQKINRQNKNIALKNKIKLLNKTFNKEIKNEKEKELKDKKTKVKQIKEYIHYLNTSWKSNVRNNNKSIKEQLNKDYKRKFLNAKLIKTKTQENLKQNINNLKIEKIKKNELNELKKQQIKVNKINNLKYLIKNELNEKLNIIENIKDIENKEQKFIDKVSCIKETVRNSIVNIDSKALINNNNNINNNQSVFSVCYNYLSANKNINNNNNNNNMYSHKSANSNIKKKLVFNK